MSHTSDYTSFLQDFAEDRAPGAFNRGDLLFHLHDQPLLNMHLLLLALLPARSLSSILRLSDKKRKDRQFNRVGILCRYYGYKFYTIVVFLIMMLALPYYVYVEQGFHTDVSTKFKVFLIIVNLQPPLAWLFGLLYFRKGFEDYEVKKVQIGKDYDERICERANEDGIKAHEWQRERMETREAESARKKKKEEDTGRSESEPRVSPDVENALAVHSASISAPEPSYHNTDPEKMESSKKDDDIDSKQNEFFKKHETQSSKAHFRRVAVAMFDDPEIQLADRARLNKRTSLHLRVWMALSLLLNAIYVLWLWLNVYNGPFDFSDLKAWTKGIFIVLPLTFWYRLSAPSTLCVFFSSLCGYHIEKMLIYERMHPRRKEKKSKEKPKSWEKIKFLSQKLTFNILNRESTEKAFQLSFVSIHVVPWVSVSYMVYLTWSDARELAEAWFFIPYAFLCLAEAFWIFWFAAEITESSIVVRNRIYKDIATKSIDFHDELKSVVGYLEWANQCYVGFKVLGIPISRSTAAQALQLFVVIVVPIITQRIIAVK
eukprot:TRINITY_DN1370_c0_g1_i5.p1 TRINITY_DN1370_c0_g1~~TRINITY_DN1370_c0_g1_i5.p1  ORF type:complete len:544 (+),score=106.43 TRINITY_DN1370_c0_g1_i5:31-1662(+)